MKKISFSALLIFLFTNTISAQVVVGFQGGEPGNTWGFTSTGADATAMTEATLSPNIVSGTSSLVVGGNTPGGSCIDFGSGNGPSVLRQFAFNPLDISASSFSTRTLVFNWGTRFPTCVGTGWDSNEDLVFTAYHDGVAQPSATLAVGNNNAVFNIATHQFTWSIPTCVNEFYFKLEITTNRRDELLFIDNVKLTAPNLNSPIPALGAITGTTNVCSGSTQTLSIAGAPNTVLTWSGIPSAASFTSTNSTTASTSMGINWGSAAPGTYTISVTPYVDRCGVLTPGTASTITITVGALQITTLGNATICAGQSTEISASGATSYVWDQGLGAGSTFTVSPTVTTTYQVTGSSNGCSATASLTVTVTNAPVVSVVSSESAVCTGNPATLTASGATNYTWLPTASLNTTTGASVIATPTTTTTYTITGTNGNCSSTTSFTITVNAIPVVSIVASSNTICSGSSATLTASGATNYQWLAAPGLSSTSGAVVTVNPTITTTYTVTGSTGSCDAPTSITITVLPPATGITITASSNTTCGGNPVTLTAAGGTNYNWQPAAGLSATTGPVVTAGPSITTTYNVTGLIGNCAASASITITVAEPSVSITASNNAICAGNSTTLTAVGATTYNWAPSTGLSASTGTVVTANPLVTTTYTVTGTINGCQATANITVTVSTAAINAGNDVTVCAGNPVTFNASGGATYSWDNGVTNGVPFVPTSSQAYTVVGTTTDGCMGTDQLNVTVEAAPTAQFTSNVQTGCLPLNVQFTSTTNSGIGFNWNFGDGTFSTDINPAHTFYSSGCKDITLEVTSANGCSRIFSMNDYICTDASPLASFTVNPTELSESNPQANFINTSENASTYLWNFGDLSTSTEISPTHVFSTQNGNYVVTLIAYSPSGCVDSVKVTVPFSESPIYYVPNAFTPDGNEFNQVFQPVFTAGFDPFKFNLEIFNRWGQVVFESSDYRVGWDGVSFDGTIVPDGTYTWRIVFNLKNSDDRRVINGHVTLLR